MKFVDVVVLLDAILLIVMGILGYAAPTSGHPSIISLIAGAGLGALLLGALAFTKTNPRVGRISSAVIALIPLGKFGKELADKPSIYPSGIIVAAGLFTVGVLMGGHFMAKSKGKASGS